MQEQLKSLKNKKDTGIKKKIVRKNTNTKVNVKSSDEILDFNRIISINEDLGMVDCKNNEYLMIAKITGVNIYLLSYNERILLEENFTSLINGIDFPIQFYSQSNNIEFDSYIQLYGSRAKEIEDKFKKILSKIEKETDLDKLEKLNSERFRIGNQLQYARNLINYLDETVRRSLLERNHYIIIKYEHNSAEFENELTEREIFELAINDLTTKFGMIVDSLERNEIKANILNAIELAELQYKAYNKHESENLKLRGMIKSQYNHLFTTVDEPVELKKVRANIQEIEEIEKKMSLENEKIRI